MVVLSCKVNKHGQTACPHRLTVCVGGTPSWPAPSRPVKSTNTDRQPVHTNSPFVLVEYQAGRHPVVPGDDPAAILQETAANSQLVQRATVRYVVDVPCHPIHLNDRDRHVHHRLTAGGPNLSERAEAAVFSLEGKEDFIVRTMFIPQSSTHTLQITLC